jgi:outer membrane protein assembly factor BamE (lipoprotein component of BamABCDE complex)
MLNNKVRLIALKNARQLASYIMLCFIALAFGCTFTKVHDQNFSCKQFLGEGKLKQELLNSRFNKSDIRSKIGLPSLMDKDSSGLENWYYVNTILSSTPFYQKKFAQFIVIVKFNKQNVVQDIYLSEKLGDNKFSKYKVFSDDVGKIYLKNIIRRLMSDKPDRPWQ